ncbi:MAG: SufE family protein [Bdellovibrionaceae bacterium]|jgi:cysteine desulfuration protein SufE|nr:SufE family protein [Pseudobdellovibrionaceae bacterium]
MELHQLNRHEEKWKAFFQRYSTWQDRYKAIIEFGQKKSKEGLFPADKLNADHLVKGCQSQVWLWVEKTPDGTLSCMCQSDALITQGLCSILCDFYSGLTPQEVLQHSPQFFKDLGLVEGLTPNRVGGFMSMVKQIKTYALAYQLRS